MENEVKKSAGKVWLVPTILAVVLLIGLVVFMVIMGKGTSALADGTVTLAEAVSPLQDGTAQLSDGVDQYTGGVDTMNEAMPTLTEGVQQYTEGVDTLNGYMAKLNGAAPALASGVKQLADGSTSLKSGVDTYTGGVDQVADGIAALQAGAPTIAGGVTELTEGAKTLDGYYKAMNGIADQVAEGLKGVRKSVNDNADYQLLLTGANGVADQLDVTKGAFAQGVVGMNTIISNVNSQAGQLAAMDVTTTANGMATLVGMGLLSPAATAETFVPAAVAGAGLTQDQAVAMFTAYQMCLAGGVDGSTPATTMTYLTGLKVAGSTVYNGLNTATAETANMKPVDVAAATAAALTDNATDPTKNVHTAAATVAGGIPTVIDSVCTGLEQTADSLVETKSGKSMKSQLKAYTDGVRALYKGLTQLSDGIPTLTGGIKQLYDGSQQLKANSGALRDGSKQLADGVGTLNSSVNGKDGLVSSVAQLYNDGSNKLAENSQALRDGVKQLADGAKKLADNSQALRDGAAQLKDAAPALIDGIGQLKDGAKKVNGFTPIH